MNQPAQAMNPLARCFMACTRWQGRTRRALRHSIKLRLVLVFLLLALAMAFTFIGGVQKAFSVGWREAARPLLMDYVDHLMADIAPGGRPDVAKATALTQRLHVMTVRIDGPVVQWASHPAQPRPDWMRDQPGQTDGPRLLTRQTADGHTVTFGLNDQIFERRPRMVGYTLTVLLLLTLLAFLYVRRLLRPLDDIGAGAQRFGAGEFGQPIPVRHPHKPDELGQLAATINTMGQDIHRMLEAKRALLLAISHELRSPLTRARLHTELLPDTPDAEPQRQALLLLTLAAFLIVRRMLRPLDDIRAGAQRFGAGDFTQPIPVRHAHRPDELGQLAATINTMGHDIRQMLDAKRALLLAISHELRSPLTRARLNTELLPESDEVRPQRQALLRDLQEMSAQITDLLESERLSSPHTALQRERIDLNALVRAVIDEQFPQATLQLDLAGALPLAELDAVRLRLALRNLIDNALRHGATAATPPCIRTLAADGELRFSVRDFGPGVTEAQRARLSEAFYRADAARQRSTGGVGLGLYLCRLVAQAHGGRLQIRHAQPGLELTLSLPLQSS